MLLRGELRKYAKNSNFESALYSTSGSMPLTSLRYRCAVMLQSLCSECSAATQSNAMLVEWTFIKLQATITKVNYTPYEMLCLIQSMPYLETMLESWHVSFWGTLTSSCVWNLITKRNSLVLSSHLRVAASASTSIKPWRPFGGRYRGYSMMKWFAVCWSAPQSQAGLLDRPHLHISIEAPNSSA